MEFHPAANLFPLLDAADLRELADDIREHGLNNAIVTYEEKILDGRNRYRACQLAEVEPRFEAWAGTGSPTAWVLSENLHRRHLTQSQKAAVVVESLPLLEEEARQRMTTAGAIGGIKRWSPDRVAPKDATPSEHGKSVKFAARQAGVGTRQVERAKRLQKASPELFEEVKSGKKTIGKATTEATEKGLIPREAPSTRRRAEARPTPRRTLLGGKLPAPNRNPLPTNVPPRTRDFLNSFEDGLAVALCMKYPTLTSAQWEDVVLQMRDRLLACFEDLTLHRKPAAGAAESSNR